MSHYPQYTTGYGEDFGYNSRRGTNNSEFRNRYTNPAYCTPPMRNSTREEFAPRGNPYGPFDGMSASPQQMAATQPLPNSRPCTVPISSAGRQIMSPQAAPQTYTRPEPYDGYLPKSYNIVPPRPRTPPLRRPGLIPQFEESKQNFGKHSISRRLPERHYLRYHVPGYMGFVKNIQFLHGDTYGKTTRKCILAPGTAQ